MDWPDGLIDDRDLYKRLTKHFGVDETDRRMHDRLLSMEFVVRRAYTTGRIKRFVGRKPDSGEVMGYAYRWTEVLSVLKADASTPPEMKLTLEAATPV